MRAYSCIYFPIISSPSSSIVIDMSFSWSAPIRLSRSNGRPLRAEDDQSERARTEQQHRHDDEDTPSTSETLDTLCTSLTFAFIMASLDELKDGE